MNQYEENAFSVAVIIVTYGNRYHLLKEVVDAVLTSEAVTRIYVIDNNSINESRMNLRLLEVGLRGRMRLIRFEENMGSAYGYKQGLMEAYRDSEVGYVWLLDDDNRPRCDALDICIDAWVKLSHDVSNPLGCVSSYRVDRHWHKKAITSGNPDLVVGRLNSFMRFHYIGFISRVCSRISEAYLANHLSKKGDIRCGRISVCPYGGMFFQKKLLEDIGYPDERFYLYADDNEFSYRISKSGKAIILLLESVIDDIDKSWDGGSRISFFKYLQDGSDRRVFYSVRNRVFFEQKDRVTNLFVYQINMYIWLAIVWTSSLVLRKRKRFALIRTGIREGLCGRLGKVHKPTNSTAPGSLW